jgi:hypothetical protein
MTVDEYGLSLCAKLQVMAERCLESFEVGAMGLVLMGYQQQFFFL